MVREPPAVHGHKKYPEREGWGQGVDTKATCPSRALQLLEPPSAPPRPPEFCSYTRRPYALSRRSLSGARAGRLGLRVGAGARGTRVRGSWAAGSVQPLVSCSETTTLCCWGVRGPWCLWSRLSETYESVQTLPLSTLTPTIIRHRP